MTLDNELHFTVQVYVSGEHINSAWVTIAAFNHPAVAKNYAHMLAGATRVIDTRSSTVINEHSLLTS